MTCPYVPSSLLTNQAGQIGQMYMHSWHDVISLVHVSQGPHGPKPLGSSINLPSVPTQRNHICGPMEQLPKLPGRRGCDAWRGVLQAKRGLGRHLWSTPCLQR